MQQLGFDFLIRDDYNVNNFIVFEQNSSAFYCLNKSKEDENILNNQIIFLTGEEKCGKTHLAHIWKQQHNAKNINFNEFSKLNFDDFIQKIGNIIESFDYYLLDNLQDDFEEDKLFYILNTILTSNSAILITSRINFSKKRIRLKDLQSRVKGSLHLKIKKIVKSVVPMFIIKLFADKQINPSGEITKYLAKILCSSNYKQIYDCVNFIVVKINEKKQRLTLTFIKDIIK